MQILTDSSQGPYDGGDDTLIGVLNESSHTLDGMALSSDTNIFGFDSDGICTYSFAGDAGCPYGSTGYEGPNTAFANVNGSQTGGVVAFTNTLTASGSLYFSLEEPLTGSVVFAGGPGFTEQGGGPNPSERGTTCSSPRPVNCATGVFWHTFNDFKVPGRGVPLSFSRTYSSSNASVNGPLGFGWTDNFNMSLSMDASGNVTVNQENGSSVTFAPNGSGGFSAPPRVLGSLTTNSDGTMTFERNSNSIQFVFSAAGQLLREIDRNGYVTTLGYTANQLTSAIDSSGRTLTFTNQSGRIVKITDPLGRTLGFTYDASGDLVSTTDALGRTWNFTYDGNHLLTSMTNPRGEKTSNTYDTMSRVIGQVDPTSRTTTFAYSGDPLSSPGGSTTMTDRHGNQTVYDYSNLELTAVTHAAGTPIAATTTYSYDPATLGVSSVTDPNGNITSNTYDSAGNLSSTTDPLGNSSSYSYNNFNEITSQQTPLGETSISNYDANGNLLSVTDPLGQVTTYNYADTSHQGDLTSVTDPGGRTIAFTYDSNGNPATRTTSPSTGINDTTAYTYDAAGEQVCQASPTATAVGVACPPAGNPRVARTTTTSYDADGEIIAVTDPLGNSTTYGYNLSGDRTTQTVPSGDVTTTAYDGLDRPTRVTVASSSPRPTKTTAAYDLTVGQTPCTSTPTGTTYCNTTTDANGRVTVEFYDARDERIGQHRPGGELTTQTYDSNGNPLDLHDPAARVITSGYDADNHLISIDYSDGATPNVSYTYDPDGHRSAMTDGTGTTTYTYDPDGRLSAATDGAGATVRYSYGASGGITKLTYPNGKSVVRRFDGALRLISVKDWNKKTTTFGYDADGNLTSERYPNSDTATYRYNADDAITFAGAAPTSNPTNPLGAFSYTRDSDGRVTQQARAGVFGGTIAFGYDSHSRVTSSGSDVFGYDHAGNPTSFINGTTQTYNTDDQLTRSADGTATTNYTYDGLGDRTGSVPTTGPSVTYTYDQAKRLTSVKTSTSSTPLATYTYNGDGLRATKTTASGTQHFTWNPTDQSILGDGTYNFIYGPNGAPIEQITTASNTVAYFFHDSLNSTRLLLDATGAIVGRYGYSTYGSPGLFKGTISTPIEYDAGYYDAETGLLYLVHRYYDPTVGEFLTIDPADDLTHAPYTFALDNPANVLDPLGLWGWSDVFHAVGTIATVVVIGTALCVLTACVADAALATVATVGVVAGYVGAGADVASTVIDCNGHPNSANECAADIGSDIIDATTWGLGRTLQGVYKAAFDLDSSALSLLYQLETDAINQLSNSQTTAIGC